MNLQTKTDFDGKKFKCQKVILSTEFHVSSDTAASSFSPYDNEGAAFIWLPCSVLYPKADEVSLRGNYCEFSVLIT